MADFVRDRQTWHWTVRYYWVFLMIGSIFGAVAILVYNYRYVVSDDDVVGLVAAISLFICALLLGQGIRGWNDVREYEDRFFHVSNRKGTDVYVRKKDK